MICSCWSGTASFWNTWMRCGPQSATYILPWVAHSNRDQAMEAFLRLQTGHLVQA
jgi:hypothetical protein